MSHLNVLRLPEDLDRRTLTFNWGADPRQLVIYKGILEPMLLDGCYIWANALQYYSIGADPGCEQFNVSRAY